MAKSTGSSPGAIDGLLAERAQYESWLSKLAASNAPESVREKVRGDYEGRLSKVMEQLRQHADEVAAELERQQTSLQDLERREERAQETVAEAELRHAVGEFDERKWEEISRSQKASLEGVRGELKRVRSEIDRLSEVQSVIEGDPDEPPEPEAAKAEVRPEPAPATDDRGKAGLPGDELDFLKSVTMEPSSKPLQSVKAEATPAPKAAAVSPPPAAVPPEPPPAPKVTATPESPKPATATAQAKTLKCNECGTLNRPTEWYCERCGAELAAL